MKQANAKTLQFYNERGELYSTITAHGEYMLAKWQGHLTSDEVIEAAIGFLELLQQHPCAKLLNDKSDVTGDWQDANDWLEYDWMPKIYQAGLRCMAHIYSLSMFSQLSAIDLQQRINPPIIMKNFTDFDTALDWILQCESDEKPVAAP